MIEGDAGSWVWGGDSLKRNAFALLVHERQEPCQTLKAVLKRLGVDTFSASSYAEADHLLEQTHPHLLFTDTALPDGTWIDMVTLAQSATASICAILVGPSADSELRQTALNYGALDFVFPPFDADVLSRLVDQAMVQVRTHRERRSRTAVA